MSEPEWLAELRARADRPALRRREPLRFDSAASSTRTATKSPWVDASIGSVEPDLAGRMVAAGLPLRPEHDGWTLEPPADAALHRLAHWLHANGLCSSWRNELLDVDDERGHRVGVVERAAVRPLGIATRAVHLVGRTPAGEVWVQQRARDKAVDPGLWDTTMGGLVAAGEGIAATLARETDEEAGLAIGALQGLAPAGRISIRRPVADGYMVERIEIFEAVVPRTLQPVNRDGEVERFECLAPDALLERLRAGEFTLEAALILAEFLQRRGHLRD